MNTTTVVSCPGWFCDDTAPLDVDDDPRWSTELREHLELAHGLTADEARRLVTTTIRALDEPPC